MDHISITSPVTPDTCTSTSSSSSAPQYSEDLRRPLNALDLLPRQGSQSSTKTCEVDLGDEERDTFSPVSSNNSPSEDHILQASTSIINNDPTSSSSIAKDNKHFEPSLVPLKLKINNSLTGNLHPTPSKEEKQRQNEEIVILETSSISSETGSWESVFPQAHSSTINTAATMNDIPQHDVDLSNYCVGFLENSLNRVTSGKEESASTSKTQIKLKNKDLDLEPLARERTYSAGHVITADTSSLFKGCSTSSLQRELLINKTENPLTASQTSNCFIDASSLCDEDDIQPFKPSLIQDALPEAKANCEEDSPTKKLETFHKAFARCKVKSKESFEDPLIQARPKSSSSCSSDDNGDNKNDTQLSNDSVSNLSDEEKLWKRDHNNPLESVPQNEKFLEHQKNGITTINDDPTEASVSLAHDVDSSDSSDVFKIRNSLSERKFTNFSYHPSTNQSSQYSNLPLQHPKLLSTHAQQQQTGAHSDVSYTTDYSSSSPAPSLQWSEHEHRPNNQQHHNIRHHMDDFEGTKLKVHSSLLPETPHNSIVHIEPNTSSNTSSIHRDYTLSSSFSHHRDSGAYCSDATDSPVPMPRTPKRSKFDEANPIISGGSCIADYQSKPCDSPSLKRKTETCPIVSGGFTSLDFESTQPIGDDMDDEDIEVEMRQKPKLRKPLPGIASWVVNMSDCQGTDARRKSTSSTSSLEASHTKFRERTDSNSSNKSGCGFYISLDDMEKKPKEKKSNTTEAQMSKSFNAPSATKFFVNLSTSEYKPKEELKVEAKNEESSASNSQKNLFSMFIDFGNGNDKSAKPKGRKEPFNLAQRLSSSLNTQHNSKKLEQDTIKTSSASSTETLMSKSNQHKNPNDFDISNNGESKSLDYKVNLDPPITVAAIRRISLQQKAQHEANKRHSWSNNSNNHSSTEYKRSISLTNNNDGKDGSKGLMSIIDKLPLISKTSSLSIDSSLSPYDEYTGSKSELSTSSGGEREEDDAGNAPNPPIRLKKRRRDVQINETFDKSSLASITDGILSKDLSPLSTTDTDDLTFQQDEEQAAREAAEALQNLQQAPSTSTSSSQIPIATQNLASSATSARMSNIIMETIIEAKETSSPKKINTNLTMDSLQATIEKQKMLLETVTEHAEAATDRNSSATTFVKLSDMDKPIKLDLKSPERMSTSVGNNHRQINRLYRGDDNRVRPHSWSMSRSTGNTFHNFTNSVENLRSLSRLFPNFSKEISNSLPNDMALDHMDYIQTDLSADSSLASSISRSGMDESSISCRQPRRLGEDLLKMFLQEIATDMIVEVHGRRIKAHKCILRSRCQYFAAMLAGNQSTSVVSLPGYSFSAVHFALCHIYSGASHPPDGISLMELAALADLLGLEGLKEVTAHALKTNYCHNFHKPCSGCIDGILQVLPVAFNHALDDLYRKCLRWTCRHFVKVWPTRQFAQLPADILGRCRQQIVAYLTSETVLDCVLDCGNLAQLETYHWGGPRESLVCDILDAAYTYIAEHFASLIASDSFLSLGHDRSCHIPRLEGVLLSTASSLTPDQACRSYQRITRLNTVLQAKVIQMPAGLGELPKELQGLQEEDLDWDVEYIRLVSSVLASVEQCLIRQCSRAMRLTAWQRMDLDLRKKIQTLARLTEPLDMKRGKPVSKAFSFGGSTRNQDLQQVKLAIQAYSKKTNDTQVYKATQTHDTVQTTERGVQANHDLREGTSRVLKSNSRAHVPQSLRGISQSTVTSERNSVNLAATNHHRRTKSEAAQPTKATEPKKPIESRPTDSASKQKAQPLKLADVRPRYLEPKKSHSAASTNGPVRSSTSSNIPAGVAKKQSYQQSSSESSRHSSPAARKQLNGKVATIKSTNNMSLDSLASTSCRQTRSKASKSSDIEKFSDLGADSLNESMKSSVITNKTASRESLTSTRLARAKNIKSDTFNNQNQKTKTLNGTTKPSRPTSLGPRAPKYLQQKITSTGSSPSSVTTTKSNHSRLSSVSSTQSSRDLYKRSISVPGQNDAVHTPTKHSFLSAKSREILARRAEKEKNKQQELLKQSQESNQKEQVPKTFGGPVMRSASHSSVLANRNNQPSNIPTRRPNTLHIKKAYAPGLNTKTNTNQQQQQTSNNKNRTTLQNSSEIYQTAQAVKQKIELLIKSSNHIVNNENNGDIDYNPPIVVESKLERSSTFCKDSADVDLNELQIIE